MKKMKKVLAGLLATTMVMSMSFSAFGAGGNVGKTKDFEDDRTVTITKYYKETNEGSVSPVETFEFELKSATVLNAADGVNDDNIPLPADFNVSLAQGAASYDANNGKGATGTITVNLPEISQVFEEAVKGVNGRYTTYPSVGVYQYVYSEVNHAYAGVDYCDEDITLVVTIIQDTATKKIRVGAVHCETPAGVNGTNKRDNFTNTYSAGTLTVSKKVEGLLGDQNKDFSITVTFYSDKVVKAPIYNTAITEEIEATDDKVLIDVDEWTEVSLLSEPGKTVYMATETFALSHNTSLTFYNIPAGVKYSVDEDSYYTSDGYTVIYSGNYEESEGDATVTYEETGAREVDLVIGTISQDEITLIAEDDTVEITNTKEGTIDTGIILDSAPYILLLALAAMGVFAVVNKKREEEF